MGKRLLRIACIVIGLWLLFVALVFTGIAGSPLAHAVGFIFCVTLALAFFLAAAKLKQGAAFKWKPAARSMVLRGLFMYGAIAVGAWIVLWFAQTLAPSFFKVP